MIWDIRRGMDRESYWSRGESLLRPRKSDQHNEDLCVLYVVYFLSEILFADTIVYLA